MATPNMHVSRTTAPDAWLPGPGKKGVAVANKRALVASQLSVSTINSDLFPELLSWSAVMEAQDSQSLKPVPSDINTSTEELDVMPELDVIPEDNLDIPQSLFFILDPTSIEFGFDATCLAGLDDLLLENPLDAFTEMCWSSVNDPPPPPPFPRRPSAPHRHQRVEVPEDTLPLESRSSCETEADSDECRTVDDVYYVPAVRRAAHLRKVHAYDAPPAYEEKGSYHDLTTSFIQFEPQFAVAVPKDSVGSFPVPNSRPQKGMHRRIATFCANIPASLSLVRSTS